MHERTDARTHAYPCVHGLLTQICESLRRRCETRTTRASNTVFISLILVLRCTETLTSTFRGTNLQKAFRNKQSSKTLSCSQRGLSGAHTCGFACRFSLLCSVRHGRVQHIPAGDFQPTPESVAFFKYVQFLVTAAGLGSFHESQWLLSHMPASCEAHIWNARYAALFAAVAAGQHAICHGLLPAMKPEKLPMPLPECTALRTTPVSSEKLYEARFIPGSCICLDHWYLQPSAA